MPSGRLYCLNVYNSDLLPPLKLPPGTIKRVRALEGLPPAASLLPAHESRSVTDQHGLGGPPMLKRRFLGEAPVDEDGSFNLHVPANVPIELQILDADGLALASCSWIWVKNNEPRGCIGCHEDPELVPENRLVSAVARPSVELILPPDRRRSVDFTHDVAPIIRSRCISCHGAGGFPPRLDGNRNSVRTAGGGRPNESYASLMQSAQSGNPESPGGGKYVTPGRARTSPLIWHLFGRNTSRPWDPAASRPMKPMPPPDGVPLSESERRAFVEWIDTGAHWDSRTAPPSALGDSGVRGLPERR
jgi:hypothetical protein